VCPGQPRVHVDRPGVYNHWLLVPSQARHMATNRVCRLRCAFQLRITIHQFRYRRSRLNFSSACVISMTEIDDPTCSISDSPAIGRLYDGRADKIGCRLQRSFLLHASPAFRHRCRSCFVTNALGSGSTCLGGDRRRQRRYLHRY
jgi:hypothetical protein